MPTKLTAAVLVVVSALALAACGNPKKKDQAATNGTATPTQALQEIDYVRKDLLRVTNEVSKGSRGTAVEIAKETYVQHFEKVEAPLDKVDHELNEELEDTIREKLREKISGGAKPGEVSKLVDDVKADLDTAEAKLK